MFDFMKTIRVAASAAVVTLGLAVGGAQASTFTLEGTTAGNDCTGVLGTSPNCVLDGSPQIGKIDFQQNSSGVWEWGVFGDLTSAFTITLGTGDLEGTGTFSYNPGPTDPGITGFTVKGGNFFNTYTFDGTAYLGVGVFDVAFSAPINPANDKPFGVSHIVFFDSVAPIPLPAAGWLLIGGLGALVAVRRRRKAA